MKNSKSHALGIPFGDRRADATGSAQWRTSPPWALERELLRKLLNALGNPAFQVVLWNGEAIGHEECRPGLAVHLQDRAVLWRLLTNPMLHFGDDYSMGRIIVEGGLRPLLDEVYRAQLNRPKDGFIMGGVREWLRRARRNTLSRARDNIHHHYDIGNDFYRLWLDREMAYTCAYFPTPEATLEQAQFAKMDLICRKLDLKPGETVAEAGCGWGGMARHMARHYGVKVKAYNISKEQIAYARERARAEGLDERIEYIEDDYRNISGQFDAFVSVGMLEHVGVAHYYEMGEMLDRILAPHGRGLIHTIGQNQAEPVSAWTEKRIFPGGYPPTLREMMGILEPFDFAVTDVENLRLHYTRTLEHWLERYETNLDPVRQMFDEDFIRAWRLYLTASAASFSAGVLQLFQVVFTRPGKNDMPWNRRDPDHLPRTEA